MRNLLLVIPGHLGKDVGATASLESDGDGSPFSLMKMQEERWINLQQAISFCVAHALSELKTDLEVRLVVPNNKTLGMYQNGLIKVLDFQKEPFTLQDRVNLANGLKADVIEFHNNSAPFVASGFEALCFSKANTDGKISESYLLCESILNSVKKNMNAKIRGTKPIYDREQKKFIEREIFIIKNTENNCIITEAGFLSNQKDLENIDVDLDGYNEQMGASIWLGYQEAYKNYKNS